MLLTLCKSKLHRATVTQAALHYEGSITIVLLNPDNTIRDTLRGGPESDLAILSESL